MTGSPEKTKTGKQSKRFRNAFLAFLGLLAGGAFYWMAREEPAIEGLRAAASSPVRPEAVPPPRSQAAVPPFHESEEAARPFPPALPPEYFRNPRIARAYRVARQTPGVLAQQPCYCYCDTVGHRSLLDCYASNHGAG